MKRIEEKTTIHSEMDTGMTAADVVEIVQLFADNGIKVHIDGGWGVDALLGAQTRPQKGGQVCL